MRIAALALSFICTLGKTIMSVLALVLAFVSCVTLIGRSIDRARNTTARVTHNTCAWLTLTNKETVGG